MKLSLILLVVVAIIGCKAQNSQIPRMPCIACSNNNQPVCARFIATGELITFQNRCLVSAMDCEHTEHRKSFNFLSLFRFRLSVNSISEYQVIYSGHCRENSL